MKFWLAVSLSGCLCLAVYVWSSCLALWDLLSRSDCIFLAVYIWLSLSALASLSGCLCLHGCLCMTVFFKLLCLAVYVCLSRSGYLLVWFSIADCLCRDVNIFYFIIFYLHDYVWQPLFACVCLAVFVWLPLLGCLSPPVLSGLWFAFYAWAGESNVRLFLSGCLCLAVHVWLSVTGCL